MKKNIVILFLFVIILLSSCAPTEENGGISKNQNNANYILSTEHTNVTKFQDGLTVCYIAESKGSWNLSIYCVK